MLLLTWLENHSLDMAEYSGSFVLLKIHKNHLKTMTEYKCLLNL